jgi:hypothetical protein
LMSTCAVARNQRGALTQAGAGIAASRLASWSISRGHCCLQRPFARERELHREGLMSRTVFVRVFAALALAVSLSACATRQTIADIKYNPGRYQDRTVAVEGVVTSSWGVPLVPFKLYKVDDGTGEMTVLANNGRTPSKGSRVKVKGRVSDVAMFGGQSLGLHLEQKDIDFQRR